METEQSWKAKASCFDPFLILALLLGLVLCLYGIQWGLVESWNPDQMALRWLLRDGELPFHPGWFLKPPFHTYFNFFFAYAPARVVQETVGFSQTTFYQVYLLWSRGLVVCLFLGSVVLMYAIGKRFFGLATARVLALVLATSAGILAYAHFLTSDVPVLFWMLLAFYFAQHVMLEKHMSAYLLAGFFTGIATATKYNGLAVGIAIPMAHLLSFHKFAWSSWRELMFGKKFLLGLVMVPVGFLAGNPFAVLDWPTFVSDFMYNYKSYPVYGGVTTGHSYWKFLVFIPQIIGYPLFVVSLVGMLFVLIGHFGLKKNLFHVRPLLLPASVFLLYYVQFGDFPRLKERAVLAVVPYFLILFGPLWQAIPFKSHLVKVILLLVLSYNVICGFFVGKRFAEDPRTQAQGWVQEHIQPGSSMEVSPYAPQFNRLDGVELDFRNMPNTTGLKKLFKKMFKDDAKMLETLKKVEAGDRELWYTLKELERRKPDYIAIDSLYYNHFASGSGSELYPSIQHYFEQLLSQQYPYKIVFDGQSQTYPWWIYPKEIDFLHNRITLFQKTSNRS